MTDFFFKKVRYCKEKEALTQLVPWHLQPVLCTPVSHIFVIIFPTIPTSIIFIPTLLLLLLLYIIYIITITHNIPISHNNFLSQLRDSQKDFLSIRECQESFSTQPSHGTCCFS